MALDPALIDVVRCLAQRSVRLLVINGPCHAGLYVNSLEQSPSV